MFQQLPLLNYLQDKFRTVDLSNVALITCQHTLQSNYITFQYLFELGLKPENVFLICKVYSYNKIVADALAAQGVHIHPASIRFDSHRSYDEQFHENVSEFVDDAMAQISQLDVKKIIVVDDGGYLLSKIQTVLSEKEVVGVEWTTAGYRKVLASRLSVPVLNMARSNSKLRIESPMIAWAVLSEIQRKFPGLFRTSKKSLVIGAGPIGISMRNGLRNRGKDATVIDAYTEMPRTFEGYDLVVGCSGHSTIGEDRLVERGEIFLISGSSSDREFPATAIRRHSPQTNDSHKDFGYSSLILANAGFPINFDGGTTGLIPLEWIQLTLGLTFSSICTVATTPLQKGLNLFPVTLDEEITDTYIKIAREIEKPY